MGHYDSTNTEVLDTYRQEDGNLRMLLYHHCADSFGEFIIGSYFCEDVTSDGVSFYSWDWGHYFQDIVTAVDYWKEVLNDD